MSIEFETLASDLLALACIIAVTGLFTACAARMSDPAAPVAVGTDARIATVSPAGGDAT